MKKSVLLGLGGALMAGGYALKRYLDGKIADKDNLYSDYKDAAMGEGGKVVLKGLKGAADGLAWGYEQLFDEPLFDNELEKEAFERQVQAKQALCEHLQGAVLAPNLVKIELKLAAHLSREEFFSAHYDEREDEAFGARKAEFGQLSGLLQGIYELENECFKTHEKVAFVAGLLGGFKTESGDSEARLEQMSTYKVSDSKYDLAGFDEDDLRQIALLKEHLGTLQTNLDEKAARIKDLARHASSKASEKSEPSKDEQVGENSAQIAQKAKFDEQSVKNSAPNASQNAKKAKKDTIKGIFSGFNGIVESIYAEKEAFKEALCAHALITSDFAENGNFKKASELISVAKAYV